MFSSRMGRTLSSILLVGAVVAVALSGWSVFAQTRTTPAAQSTQQPAGGASMPRTITVVGNGTVSITPDIATAHIGVETAGANVREAIDEASETLAEGYGYQWWIPAVGDGSFSAIGVYNQFVYVHPAHEVVVVKLSANRAYGTTVHEEQNREGETLAFLAHCAAWAADA